MAQSAGEDDAAVSSSCIGMQDYARQLARSGRDVIHLDRGELDFDTPEPIVTAAIRALKSGHTRYTDSAGSPELRAAICTHYQHAYNVDIDPARVFVHAGSSPLLLALFLTVLAPHDEVLIPDPGYPAYATCVRAARGRPRAVACDPRTFRYTADEIKPEITAATAAIVVNSPCNPTGRVMQPAELAACAELGPLVVSDEAYHGVTLDAPRPRSILEFADNAVVLNTFSKAFAMTGWRLGFMIVPPRLVPLLSSLQQDSAISPNAFVQEAGIAALTEAGPIAARWRDELRSRRDCLIAGLASTGLTVSCHPEGGFYAFARLPDPSTSSARFALRLLEEEAVAVVAGSYFGPAGEGHIRCSFTQPADQLREGAERIASFMRRESRQAPAAAQPCRSGRTG